MKPRLLTDYGHTAANTCLVCHARHRADQEKKQLR